MTNSRQTANLLRLLQPAPPTTAIADGTYPSVWNNDSVDGSFGITSKIFLDQIAPDGTLLTSLEVPNSSQNGVPPTKDQMVTSFSSKSELALNLSSDGSYLTFMGYLAPIDAIDVSNANTPGVVDPTNPVGENVFRVVAQVNAKGQSETNAYSGNNGRAAILNNTAGANFLYTAGNAGNGGNPQPDGIILGAGEQFIEPQVKSLVAQNPGVLRPSVASTLRNYATRLIRLAKTPTSAASRPSITSSIPPRAVAATASIPFTSLIPPARLAPPVPTRAFLAASAFLKVPQPCRPRGFLMTHRSCRRTAWFPTTCAS